jgi:hypothetical protein
MMANDFPDIPHEMRKVQRRFERRFEQWRSAHAGVRLPIPERLWKAATRRPTDKNSRFDNTANRHIPARTATDAAGV